MRHVSEMDTDEALKEINKEAAQKQDRETKPDSDDYFHSDKEGNVKESRKILGEGGELREANDTADEDDLEGIAIDSEDPDANAHLHKEWNEEIKKEYEDLGGSGEEFKEE